MNLYGKDDQGRAESGASYARRKEGEESDRRRTAFAAETPEQRATRKAKVDAEEQGRRQKTAEYNKAEADRMARGEPTEKWKKEHAWMETHPNFGGKKIKESTKDVVTTIKLSQLVKKLEEIHGASWDDLDVVVASNGNVEGILGVVSDKKTNIVKILI